MGLYLRRFSRVFVVLFLPMALCFSLYACGSILDRWWICTIVEELCVALREEFRYSLVGRSVGRSVGRPAGGCVWCVGWSQRESWCVSSLGGPIECAPVYAAELGGSRPLQNEFVSARACVRVLCLNRRRSSGSGYSF